MTKQYSDKELQLFEYFGFGKLLVNDGDERIAAPVIYRMLVEKAFADNMQGPEVESLRRCFNALQQCSPYRLTEEWDALIEFQQCPKGVLK